MDRHARMKARVAKKFNISSNASIQSRGAHSSPPGQAGGKPALRQSESGDRANVQRPQTGIANSPPADPAPSALSKVPPSAKVPPAGVNQAPGSIPPLVRTYLKF